VSPVSVDSADGSKLMREGTVKVNCTGGVEMKEERAEALELPPRYFRLLNRSFALELAILSKD
jgi:hypothetical protein